MNNLPSKPQVNTAAIQSIRDFKDVRQWLKNYTTTMDEYFLKLKDTLENFGAGTENWDFRESTAEDVTDGNAHAVGNALIIHKTSGVKREYSPPT